MFSVIIGILDNRKNVFDGSWHDTALLTRLPLKRVCLSRLRWAKEDDRSIFTFNKGLDKGFDTLSVELILLLDFAEDIVKVKHVGIISIRSTSLSVIEKKKRVRCMLRNAPFLHDL